MSIRISSQRKNVLDDLLAVYKEGKVDHQEGNEEDKDN
jgi:hypothetical protein